MGGSTLVGHDAEFWHAFIGCFLNAVSSFRPSADEIRAHVMRLEAGGIDRGERHLRTHGFCGYCRDDTLIHEFLEWSLARESMCCFLESGEVRDFLEFKYGAEIGRVDEYFPDTPIIGGEEFFQHEAGDKLRLGELLGALLMCIEWKGMFCCGVGDKRNRLR